MADQATLAGDASATAGPDADEQADADEHEDTSDSTGRDLDPETYLNGASMRQISGLLAVVDDEETLVEFFNYELRHGQRDEVLERLRERKNEVRETE